MEEQGSHLLKFIGPDGVLEVDLDEMRSNALSAAARIATVSQNGDELAEAVARELRRGDADALSQLMYAALVLEALAAEIFAPLLSYVQVRERDYDFLSELRMLADRHRAGGQPVDDKADQGGHDNGLGTVERN